jgi:hypothetical protein
VIGGCHPLVRDQHLQRAFGIPAGNKVAQAAAPRHDERALVHTINRIANATGAAGDGGSTRTAGLGPLDMGNWQGTRKQALAVHNVAGSNMWLAATGMRASSGASGAL